MAKYQIVGIHPKLKVSRIFALYAPESEIEDYMARGRAEGWTDLTKHNAPQPSLWPDESDENTGSASSEKEPSPKTRRKPSVISGGASRAGATPSFPFRARERRRQ